MHNLSSDNHFWQVASWGLCSFPRSNKGYNSRRFHFPSSQTWPPDWSDNLHLAWSQLLLLLVWRSGYWKKCICSTASLRTLLASTIFDKSTILRFECNSYIPVRSTGNTFMSLSAICELFTMIYLRVPFKLMGCSWCTSERMRTNNFFHS